MNYHISHKTKKIDAEINLPKSKSLSNRALIIKALCSESFTIEDLSSSKDTQLLSKALHSQSSTINVGDSGTAFRFLTALLSTKSGEFMLSGSERMKERPIKDLVNALTALGADIEYLEKEGYPPLKIAGKTIEGGKVSIDASISSQFVSALLLIAPSLKKGLEITLLGNVLSKPYISMTLKMMTYFGVDSQWDGNTICVKKQSYVAKDIQIEGDWSALAFLLEILVLSEEGKLKINGLFEESWQGDYKLLEIFKLLGIESKFQNSSLYVSKRKNSEISKSLDLSLVNYPDLAQAYCCSLVGLSRNATISGLQNLKYKESHRLAALKKELEKLNQKSEYTDSEIKLQNSKIAAPKQNLETHNDHRMAMCLAPFGILFDVKINDVEVVSKSYPTFWEDLKKMGFIVTALSH
ncbi:3-phosphoshikimate 1-carboxyvinyltransferase [Flavobacteriales bacterium]|nr:3-phosphoshikimate 1-carboxyvinyltransferase [Flavobacteriales bacterium]